MLFYRPVLPTSCKFLIVCFLQEWTLILVFFEIFEVGITGISVTSNVKIWQAASHEIQICIW